MKQLLRHIFLLVAMLVATASLTAQTYNGDTWYSLYDEAEYSKSTTTGVNNNITICTHSVFTPSTGALEFKTRMTKFVLTNPGEYSILVGGKTIDLPSKQTSYVTKTTTISSTE